MSALWPTFVLTICSLRGELLGCVSGAPTRATSDVQNSISTTPVAPWSSGVSAAFEQSFASPSQASAGAAPQHPLLEWTLPNGSQFSIVYPFLCPIAIQEKSWLKLQHWIGQPQLRHSWTPLAHTTWGLAPTALTNKSGWRLPFGAIVNGYRPEEESQVEWLVEACRGGARGCSCASPGNGSSRSLG